MIKYFSFLSFSARLGQFLVLYTLSYNIRQTYTSFKKNKNLCRNLPYIKPEFHTYTYHFEFIAANNFSKNVALQMHPRHIWFTERECESDGSYVYPIAR